MLVFLTYSPLILDLTDIIKAISEPQMLSYTLLAGFTNIAPMPLFFSQS